MSDKPHCPQCDAVSNTDLIFFHSGINQELKGFVHIAWGNMRAQLSSKEVRQHALNLIACAEASDSDEIFMAMLMSKIGLGKESASSVIAGLREIRDKRGLL